MEMDMRALLEKIKTAELSKDEQEYLTTLATLRGWGPPDLERRQFHEAVFTTLKGDRSSNSPLQLAWSNTIVHVGRVYGMRSPQRFAHEYFLAVVLRVLEETEGL